MEKLKQEETALEQQNDLRIHAIQIGLASAEMIRSWSRGEITKPETINYKSLKPERGGLFDEVIFGPIKDYECTCGKYKKVRYRGKRCERCGVEITESIVRRERVGHIDLACPVTHTWMIKELPLPSKISLVLGMTYKQIEEVVYFQNYIVLDPGFLRFENERSNFSINEILNLADFKQSIATRTKLRRLIKLVCDRILATKNNDADDIEYLQGMSYYKNLQQSNLPFSVEQMFKFLEKYSGLRVGIGAEAIEELLQNIELEKVEKELEEQLLKDDHINYTNTKTKRILRRLSVIRWLINSGNRPEWMVLRAIPVIPPDLRPIIQLEGGRFTTSDINTFYRRIIIRNQRLKRVLDLNAASIIINNEKRMLQEAVDSLIDNNARKKPLVTKDKHPLKSLTEHLKGKQGLFRQNLLGKRVDYSARSVIVVGPELKMYEVGLPILMVLKLFKPFIIRELIRNTDKYGNDVKPIVNSIRAAEKMILRQDPEIWPIVHQVIKERPVLLNRAPTLHRLGIQAFEPRIIEGKAIQLHPLVTPAFNADFDGDQMAVHMPISEEAIAEARSILLAPWHILGPKDGKPVITPTQDMILGIYYLTNESNEKYGTGSFFSTIDEAVIAYELKKIHLHAIIAIPTKEMPHKKFPKQGILITTVGKLILNRILPKDFIYLNQTLPEAMDPNEILSPQDNVAKAIANKKIRPAFNKNALSKLILAIYNNYSPQEIPIILDHIKHLGFEYSTKSSTTVSAFDVPHYQEKYELFEKADAEVAKQKSYYAKGLLTNDERYRATIKIWNDVKDQVSKGIKSIMSSKKEKDNPIMIMAESGARGNVSNFTQLSGMRGLMSKSYNYNQKHKSTVVHDIIEMPIKHSFIEGLTVLEYFNSSYGARKGMTDTAMKTAETGYMTRKLVDANQEVIVREHDCGTRKGLILEDIVDTRLSSPIELLEERMLHRMSNENIYHPKTKELIVGRNQIIDETVAAKIIASGIKKVEVRSILACQLKQGICQMCFGNDLTTRELIAIGTAIGVIAAQSIGEPGTQLTMRTFHSGGVAGESNLVEGFERLKQLFNMITPKEWETAVISELNGVVESIETKTLAGAKVAQIHIKIRNEIDYRVYIVNINSSLRVAVGDKVSVGDKITEGSIDIRELLKIAGINAVRNYMIKEVQKVYRLQGIEIADKYVEVIIRQLTSKVQIQSPNDSSWFIHEIVDVNLFREESTRLLLNGKNPPTIVNIVLGLEQAPANTNSFLSAASFQDTKKILTDAAVKGQIDNLYSLKENVIMGNLIPAGTGLKTAQEVIDEANKLGRFNY
ncbi:DNA-directed RNA polymerase subunit beta' [[Mycoplasma] cavipharyngis]|uniref:DNA-directed RNA polymerase subunit beta' n=1 Tax=[Mycoplasma] cavipharyngis TaxID=92757 RepID=UPI003703DA21